MTARSQLLRCEVQAAGGRRGTLLALHSDGADARELVPLCRAAALDFDVLAPQAARSRNPFLSSAPPGDARWADYAGFAWYGRDDLGRPEPASFGDSLWQIEQLLLEIHERGDGAIYLLGYREGATLAYGAALAVPELLDGVIAIDGAEPVIPGWSDARTLARDLPLAMIRADYTDPRQALGEVQKFLDERTGG